MNKSKIKTLFLLHIMLMIYSMSGICSKMASKQEFLSTEFCFYYAMIIILLGFYAIGCCGGDPASAGGDRSTECLRTKSSDQYGKDHLKMYAEESGQTL